MTLLGSHVWLPFSSPGMVDAAVMPLLAYLVDRHHVATYGTVYAIAQVALCLAFAAGMSNDP